MMLTDDVNIKIKKGQQSHMAKCWISVLRVWGSDLGREKLLQSLKFVNLRFACLYYPKWVKRN
jgi:hypothetical protein